MQHAGDYPRRTLPLPRAFVSVAAISPPRRAPHAAHPIRLLKGHRVKFHRALLRYEQATFPSFNTVHLVPLFESTHQLLELQAYTIRGVPASRFRFLGSGLLRCHFRLETALVDRHAHLLQTKSRQTRVVCEGLECNEVVQHEQSEYYIS